MINSIKNSLSEREIKRIRESFELSVNVISYIVNQPETNNSEWIKLSELVDKETAYCQLDIFPTKVKSILLKSDTGLVANDFFLFSHVVLGTVEGTIRTIVSGRHRVAALVTVCDIMDIPLDNVGLYVIVVQYPNEKLLARSIAAYNTNRTMTGAERDRVMVSSEIDGETPTAYAAKGKTSNKSSCKKFFKQVCLTEVLDNVDKDDPRHIITVNNLGNVFGFMFDILTNDNPEFFKQLKSGDVNSWVTVELLAAYAYNEGYLDQPEGQISRGKTVLFDKAYRASKDYFLSLTDSINNEEQSSENAF
jgi:hypothetical protein